MKNRFLAIVLAVCMVLPLLPLVGVLSYADGVMYYDENGEAQYYNGAFGSTDASYWGTENETTWIYIDHDMTINRTIMMRGQVHLIIANGVTLDLGHRDQHTSTMEIASYHDRTLTIYAQSKDKNTAGTLKAESLGCEQYRGFGTLTINGGNFVCGTMPYVDGAGIGMYASDPLASRRPGGTLTINGGFIKAYGANYGAGIGGSEGSCIQTININGGEIEAHGGYGSPGIGTSLRCTRTYEECTININGGTIYAYGGIGAPGIGSGFDAKNKCTVNITGGEITAVANAQTEAHDILKSYTISEPQGAAGIGTAAFTQGETIVNISGGTINATANNGAGIGGSQVNNGTVAVNISGGTINATSEKGAGIGSGYNQNQNKPVTVNITGGDITAESSEGKGIGDGLNTNETTVRIAGTDIVHHSVTANSYNANTVIEGDYKNAAVVGTSKITTPSEAAGITIRPIVYDYEFGNPKGPFIEMTGCERKDLKEFLAESLLPILDDRVIYVVNEDITVEALWVFGTSVLYLCKDATLTVTNSIIVIHENMDGVNAQGNLIIVAEAEDSGKLVCGTSTSSAAIGSYFDDYKLKTYETGLIRVYSGTVEAHGGAGYPAIGGPNLTYSQYGGVVKAYGGEGAPGIGLFAGDTTGSASIDLTAGRLIAHGGTTAQPMGLGGTNASINASWRFETDSYDLDPCVGTVTIADGKEFKYLNSSPVQAATASDFLTGGVFVPHTSTYYIDQTGNKVTVDDYIELTNNGNASSTMTTVDGAWYVCVNDARNPLQIMTITVNGTMNLILTDGTEMRPDNIVVNPGATLNIYGQYGGTGVLRVYGGQNDSGIGGDIYNPNCGAVNIYGGKIIAQASVYAAGIGGAGLSGNGGTISIYGGSVKVTPHDDGSGTLLGVGDGWNQSGAVIHYYGGRIDPGAVRGTVSFHNYFLYEDDGSRVFEDEYDPSRVIVPGLPEAAEYIDENGEEQSTYAYKRLHTDTATLTGTYYVYEDITLPARPEVSGTATLILKDGVTLTAEKGIGVNEGNTLKIYAHSRDEALTGALTVPDPGVSYAGIGGDGSKSGEGSAAVGSGSILIAGGKITATGGLSAAAIGSGGAISYYPLSGGSVTITDGFVTANGQNGPAIGMGSDTVNGVISISGGVITANNQGYAAAIGVGTLDSRNESLADYAIYITGGSVTAKANGYMSRTNIGYGGSGMEIHISGGQIDASYVSGYSACGIGFNGNVVNISGDDPAMFVKYSNVRGQVSLTGDFNYADGAIASVPLEDNKTIKPREENFASVTFDPDNGGSVSLVYVPYGGMVSAPASPEKEGYTFTGWYEDEASTPFDFEVEIGYDVVLTARYTKNVYTVTFDPDNGDETFTQQVEHGENATVPTEPLKDYATFDGWFEDGASAPFDFANTPITSPLALTAHWTYRNVTVTFDTMDGNTTTQSVVYGGHATRPADPTRAGYVFLGWRIRYAVTYFNFEGATLTSDLTLYAVWGYEPLTATAGTAGASGEGYANLLDGSTSSKWCVTSFNGCYIEFSTDDYVVPTGYVMTTANDTATNSGRNPTGWKIYGRNSVTDSWTQIISVSGSSALKGMNFTPFIFLMDNTEAYRFFKLEITSIKSGDVFQLSEFMLIVDSIAPVPDVTVGFDLGAGSGNVGSVTVPKGDAIVLPGTSDVTPPAGKAFTGWSDGSAEYQPGASYTANDNVTLTAVYVDAVTVTFVSGSQTSQSYPFLSGTVIDIPGNEPEFGLTAPEGKVFDCWELDGTNYYKDESYTVTSSVVFTAVWRDASAWEILQAQFDALEYGDSLTVTLTGDVVAPDGSSCLYIYEGTDVTIDLAGYTIDRALTSETSEGMVFFVYGNLTICDSSENGTGVVTGGYNDTDGGGFYVHYTGSLTITGGTVTGNKAYYGGGVEATGLFIMTGGTITGNTAYYYGGGFEMYDDYCGIELSGSARIYGNFSNNGDDEADPIVSNVGLYDDQYIEINGAFTNDAYIGVSTTVSVDNDAPVVFTYALDGASTAPFFSDDTNYVVGSDANGEAQLMFPTALAGDVNCDGTLNIADVTALLGVLAGGTAPGECDITGDGSLNIADVTALLGILAQN